MQYPASPRGRVEAMAVLPERSSDSQSGSKSWKLLVVDDDVSSADLSASILRKEGYTVRAAYSGPEGLAAMDKEPVDLALVDMVMPGMDGMQFLAKTKELYPETDVIVLTSFGTIEDAVEAMRRGAADFLPKPFRPRDLKRLAATVLRAKNAEMEEAFRTQSTAMLELAYLLARTPDVHALPMQAVNLARDNFDADAVVMLVRVRGDEMLSVLAHSGGIMSDWGRTERLTEQGRAAVAQQRVIVSADAATGDCYAYAPMIVAGDARGALCLRREGGPWFHEKSVELLEVFTTHLALSLETARLYDNASRQVLELEELVNVSRTLTLDTNTERICAQLLEAAQEVSGAEMCAVLLEKDGEQRTYALPEIAPGSLTLRALTSKLQTMRSDVAAATISGGESAEFRRLLRSFLSAPLQAQGKDYGVLAVMSSQEGCFSMADARRVTALATHAAAGLANASLTNRVSAMYFETIEMISALVDSTNPFTAGHSRHVRSYSSALAHALGLNPEEICTIEDGALLHDIGKLCIPSELLDKADALTAEEFAIVASHPVCGANMFRNAPHLQAAVPVVRHHHEHYDGSGYPEGLRGKAIPVGARIVAVADVFDAMLSARSYRPALSMNEVRMMIEERAGSQFDPDFAKVFLALPLEEPTTK